MLKITVPGVEHYDEESQEFLTEGDCDLELEHSLVSLSKWEQKFKKPFMSETEKTDEETLYYIECMVLTPDFPPDVFLRLTAGNLDAINAYINDEATATWFNEVPNQPRSRETITAELVYYWMFTAGIDISCERWHLNRLFTLLKIFNVKNSKPTAAEQKQSAAQRRELNAKRRAEFEGNG